MLIRISLIVAIIAGLAVGALNFLKVKEKITILQADLQRETEGRQKAEADLSKTRKELAATTAELKTTKATLETTTQERDTAVAEAEKRIKEAEKREEAAGPAAFSLFRFLVFSLFLRVSASPRLRGES